jgi:peptidoglycan pentaglycine glycine transferase (the first glycine)
MPSCSITEWNQFTAKFPDAHFLQTGEWGQLKAAFGWETVRILQGEAGAQILFRKFPFGFSIAYIPRGPIGVGFNELLSEIDEICHKRKAIFLKIEPDVLQPHPSSLGTDFPGFKISPYNIQPPNTIILDITESEASLLQNMRQKTRYNINLAEKKEVTVFTWKNIPAFHQMLTTTGKRDRFAVHSLKYYQHLYELLFPAGLCELFVALYMDQPLAAIMVFTRGSRAWYVYGASNDLERNRMPAYLLQWEAIRWAKKRGCRDYDLWGIPDETAETLEANFMDRDSGLWGVYRFKRGFGGKVKRFVQSLDKVYMPVVYSLYLNWTAKQGSS